MLRGGLKQFDLRPALLLGTLPGVLLALPPDRQENNNRLPGFKAGLQSHLFQSATWLASVCTARCLPRCPALPA